MDLFNILPLVQTIGLLGIFLLVFAETGLFFGFFLPGDSLLFTAGVLAGASYFNIVFLLLGSFVMAVLGDTVGYWLGNKMGPKIFSRPNSFFWNKNNLEKTALFFQKYGDKTIFVARFFVVVRTFAPIMAGAGKMKYRTFLFWNFLGALFWTSSMILGGYFLGSSIKNIDAYVLPVALLTVVLYWIPVWIKFRKHKKEKEKIS